MKWLNLLNLSTTTMIQLACPDVGKPSMKSIEITSQEFAGTGKGESNPG
jgi:hypothetical protein